MSAGREYDFVCLYLTSLKYQEIKNKRFQPLTSNFKVMYITVFFCFYLFPQKSGCDDKDE